MQDKFDNQGYLNMELLRFTTAGSVDDGKSTLIGRLLYDSKSIFEDQLEAVERDSKRRGQDNMNLALLTDGLKAEREQGITIDVAYRYFATPKRKFIIADTPGHIQYTRNMVTGASTANVALILVDARNGVVEQTYRHSYIASLLQIPHIIVCVNKMDIADYSQDVFEKIKAEYQKFSEKLNVKDIQYVPISALKGDNVVGRSENMKWHKGGTLMHILENIHIGSDENLDDARLPVQCVIRPYTNEHHDYRGYAGRVVGGIFRKGEEVIILPSGKKSKISHVEFAGEELEKAFPPMSATIRLEDDIDISRGDMIAKPDNKPQESNNIEIMMCWMSEEPMTEGGKYSLMHCSSEARAIIKEVVFKIDVNTLAKITDDKKIGLNDIAKVRIKTSKPICFDSYSKNRSTGSLVLIDESTNNTVGVGMII
ncbi:MAG: sulfate adenylyltransferase subunit 1 [Bacteroidales bacterium]